MYEAAEEIPKYVPLAERTTSSLPSSLDLSKSRMSAQDRDAQSKFVEAARESLSRQFCRSLDTELRAMPCGQGIILQPSNLGPDSHLPVDVPAIWLGLSLHFRPTEIVSFPCVRDIGLAPIRFTPSTGMSSATDVILAPLGLPASIVRQFAAGSDRRGRKEAEILPALRRSFQAHINQPRGAFAVCRLSTGLEVVWPVALCLVLRWTTASSMKQKPKTVLRAFHDAQPLVNNVNSLAEQTGSYIDGLARERERERRERLVVKTDSAATSPVPVRDDATVSVPPAQQPVDGARAYNIMNGVNLNGHSAKASQALVSLGSSSAQNMDDIDWDFEDWAQPANGQREKNNFNAQGEYDYRAPVDQYDAMMGMNDLTEDDFSFFDTPVVDTRPVMPQQSHASMISPQFGDGFVFDHLPPSTDIFAPSPTFLNQLTPGLSAQTGHPSMNDNTPPIFSVPTAESPYKTPRTPFTPYLEAAETGQTDEAAASPSMPHLVQGGALSGFGQIVWGDVHAASDLRYQFGSTRGKFACPWLPSPDDSEQDDSLADDHGRGRKKRPDKVIANRRRQTNGSTIHRRTSSADKRPLARGDHLAKFRKTAWARKFSALGRTPGGSIADTEEERDDDGSWFDGHTPPSSDDDDDMPVDGIGSSRSNDLAENDEQILGPGLLLLHRDANVLVGAPNVIDLTAAENGKGTPTSPTASRHSPKDQSSRTSEGFAMLLSEQILENPDFRRLAYTEARDELEVSRAQHC